MSTETTPAIERAESAIFAHDDSGENTTEDVRRGLASALDVEEMARALYEHTRDLLADTLNLPPWEAAPAAMVTRSLMRAAAIRTAILGSAS